MAGRWTSRCRSCPTRAAVVKLACRFAALLLLLVAEGVAGAEELSITVQDRALQPGEVIVVTIAAPAGTTAITVGAFGTDWPAFQLESTDWRALVGIDLDRKAGRYTLVAESTGSHPLRADQTLVVRPKQFPRRVLRVAPDYVNPPADVLARITSDAEFLRTVYEHSASEPAWRAGFTRPVQDQANSSFGTRSVFNGESRSPHAGTDFLSGTGTPVHAPASGHIAAARDLFFTGNTVIIDHGLGVFSMLAHLSRMDVREGDAVNGGDIVGLVGATGRVTGPHLHWALRVGSARVDPLSALALLGNRR